MWQHFEVAGTGVGLPAAAVTAEEVDARCDRPPGWTRDRTGVLTRYECRPPETLAGLASAAIAAAMADAGVGWGDVDLLIDGSTCRYQHIPCNAAYLLHHTGAAAGVPGMDVHGTCLGFMLGLNVANGLFATGTHRHIVLVCAEAPLQRVNWRDPESAGLFGDGAGAVVLKRAEPTRIYGFAQQNFAEFRDACQIRGGGMLQQPETYTPETDADFRFAMDGPRLVMAAIKHLPAMVDELLERHEAARDSLYVIPHQAAPRAMDILRRRLRFKPERFHDRVAEFGNMVAASVPFMLHQCRAGGTIRPGERVLLLGTSAGYAQAGLLFRL
jgi:3-oxoacyl-[acyl-carrier-protein] synthase-3